MHGTIQQEGHRLHLSTDLGIQTQDLYDTAPAIPTMPTSGPPAFSAAGWYATHPVAVDDGVLRTALRSGAITVTGTTGRDWGDRQYTGGLNKGWFLVYGRAAVSAGRAGISRRPALPRTAVSPGYVPAG